MFQHLWYHVLFIGQTHNRRQVPFRVSRLCLSTLFCAFRRHKISTATHIMPTHRSIQHLLRAHTQALTLAIKWVILVCAIYWDVVLVNRGKRLFVRLGLVRPFLVGWGFLFGMVKLKRCLFGMERLKNGLFGMEGLSSGQIVSCKGYWPFFIELAWIITTNKLYVSGVIDWCVLEVCVELWQNLGVSLLAIEILSRLDYINGFIELCFLLICTFLMGFIDLFWWKLLGLMISLVDPDKFSKFLYLERLVKINLSEVLNFHLITGHNWVPNFRINHNWVLIIFNLVLDIFFNWCLLWKLLGCISLLHLFDGHLILLLVVLQQLLVHF